MISRRGFLGAILASAAAPAIARYDWLMRPRSSLIQTLSPQELFLMQQKNLLQSGNLFVALHTGAPEEVVEASYAGYARMRLPASLLDLPRGTHEVIFPECFGGNQMIKGGALVDQFGHAIAEFRTNDVTITTGTTLKLNLSIEGPPPLER